MRTLTEEDFDNQIKALAALKQDSHIFANQRTIHDLLVRTAGSVLHSISRKHHFEANSDFYYWPGYASVILPAGHERVTLHDENTSIPTGIGYEIKGGILQPPYTINRSAVWFHRALTKHGVFEPGGTHNWCMHPDLQVVGQNGRQYKLRVLHVTTQPRDARDHIGDDGTLRVWLDEKQPGSFGRQLGSILNNPTLIKSSVRWPSAPAASTEVLDLRESLYDLWLGATFSPSWRPEPEILGEFVARLTKVGADVIAGKIVEAEAGLDAGPTHLYSHWYSMAIVRGGSELGTAMFLTSGELSDSCLGECRQVLTNFYYDWRNAERDLRQKPPETSPIDAFLDQVANCEHGDCELNRSDKSQQALAALLSIPKCELAQRFPSQLGDLVDSVKGLGIRTKQNACCTMSVIGAWALALGAYREHGSHHAWSQVFNITDIKRDLRGRAMTPAQTPERLRRTVKAFYDMCLRLFEDTNRSGHSPLTKVTLDEAALTFTLAFDSTSDRDGSSLVIKLNECCESVVRPQSGNTRQTSSAIWNFVLHAHVSDSANLFEDGLWGGYWRLNILPRRNGTTLVIFKK